MSAATGAAATVALRRRAADLDDPHLGAHESEGVVWLLSPLDLLQGASILARALAPAPPLRLDVAQRTGSGRCS